MPGVPSPSPATAPPPAARRRRGALAAAVAAAALAVAAVLLAVGAWRQAHAPAGPPSGIQVRSSPDATVPPPPPVTYPPGVRVPPLRLRTLDGGTVDLAALAGRPLLVNFWASWCPECTQEFALLRRVRAAHAGDGLAVVGVLGQDDPAKARAFARRAGATWPTGLDAGGRAARAFGVIGLPQTFFVRRDGTIAAYQLGGLTPGGMQPQLAKILRR